MSVMLAGGSMYDSSTRLNPLVLMAFFTHESGMASNPDFDASRPLEFSAAIAKETATTGQVDMSLAFQHQRTPGTFVDDVKTFTQRCW